ncbi:Eco57I restriction-modification methylase domain-containing protein, partial [Alistipes putredinis]|uniref:Eco57I restriction-modification methylase domain-containing protein n=1 Tax=Alistipes putredinis TaxID=28117 RepID=UPI003AF0A608
MRPPEASWATREDSGWKTDEPQPISPTAEFGFSDDTYNLFFFKGFSLLCDGGCITYITPKTFWTTQTKRNLRDL